MAENTKIFKALSDMSRLRILKALQSKTLCCCEISSLLGLANSTVSQHLKILKETGFISENREGRWSNYIINNNPPDPRINSILNSLDFWINDEETIIKDKNKLRTLDRETICNN